MCIESFVYLIIMAILFVLLLFAYGILKNYPSFLEKSSYYEEDVFFFGSVVALLWPLALIGLIIVGLGLIPLSLGKIVGKHMYMKHEKNNFKNIISQK